MVSKNATSAAEAPLQLGARIRQLRKRQGLTLSRLAATSGLSVGHISLIERELAQPSINALVNIARSLGVTVQWFFNDSAEQAEDEKDYIVRREQRPRLDYQSGFVDHLLTPRNQRQLEMIHCLIPPGASCDEGYSHNGEEAGFVLKGSLELFVGERQFHLEQGDSFAYSSSEPHRYRNPGSGETIVIWVITPPSF
ncbi:cupin domain-containing protein [Chromobacterium sp. Rain0013]|nr:cupin domain-containing protein [Chromobacterium sp. Rain0013]